MSRKECSKIKGLREKTNQLYPRTCATEDSSGGSQFGGETPRKETGDFGWYNGKHISEHRVIRR